jgi:hypothetical protein
MGGPLQKKMLNFNSVGEMRYLHNLHPTYMILPPWGEDTNFGFTFIIG